MRALASSLNQPIHKASEICEVLRFSRQPSPLPNLAPNEDTNVEFIDNSSRLNELADKWRELWSRLADTTPFQSPEWLLPWWRHYGEGLLFSFAFWIKGELAGFAPLYIYKNAADPWRRLFLLGTGSTDYLDAIFHPSFREQCWQALVAEIQKRAASWDECNFQRLRSDSPFLQDIAVNAGFRIERQKQEPCPVLDLRALNPANSMLKKARYFSRKLRQIHPVLIQEAAAHSLDELFGALERLHQDRWRAKSLAGALTHERDRSFHRQVAGLFLKSQILKLYALRVRERIVAVLYAFRHSKRTYFYLSGFDPEYGCLSVGSVLLCHAIEQALRDECHLFDFLRGQEPYKYRWGACDQATFTRIIKKKS